jgi:Cu+-exporting ATPase
MSSDRPGATAVKDPVCGMNVDPATAKNKFEHAGKTYYFCCPRCVQKFKIDPGKYLKPAPGLVMLGAPKPATSAASKVKDPVCGMDVDRDTAKFKFDYQGKTYAFCCGGCLEKFRANPEKYLEQQSRLPAAMHVAHIAAAPRPATAAATTYVCPMCPEVRESKPIACPK